VVVSKTESCRCNRARSIATPGGSDGTHDAPVKDGTGSIINCCRNGGEICEAETVFTRLAAPLALDGAIYRADCADWCGDGDRGLGVDIERLRGYRQQR
jgi:hypothetical protein